MKISRVISIVTIVSILIFSLIHGALSLNRHMSVANATVDYIDTKLTMSDPCIAQQSMATWFSTLVSAISQIKNSLFWVVPVQEMGSDPRTKTYLQIMRYTTCLPLPQISPKC